MKRGVDMRSIRFAAVLALAAILLCACGADKREDKTEIRIGITVYDQYDTFISELMDYFMVHVQRLEEETGATITVMRESADGSQEAQNNQVESLIESGCDVLCVNLVDRMDASVIIDKAEVADLPVIFFNRELVEEDLARNDRLFYVGADALESGIMQAEIVQRIIRDDAEKIDKNADGVYQYVMLEGEAGHQDAIVRTEYVIKTLTTAGVRLERLEDEIANWSRSQAETKMTQWLGVHGNNIELVLANNDDMALGAIAALKRELPFENWPVVVGIDGTAPGLQAVMLGEMSGTVLNDSDGQAGKLLELSYALCTGAQLPELEDGRYIRLPYRTVTKDNITEYYGIGSNN